MDGLGGVLFNYPFRVPGEIPDESCDRLFLACHTYIFFAAMSVQLCMWLYQGCSLLREIEDPGNCSQAVDELTHRLSCGLQRIMP